MRLGPCIDVLPVSRVCIDPGLSYRIVQIGPLRHDVRGPLILILLKPGFNVRSHQLPRLRAALILHDWSQYRCDTVAQKIVGGRVR